MDYRSPGLVRGFTAVAQSSGPVYRTGLSQYVIGLSQLDHAEALFAHWSVPV